MKKRLLTIVLSLVMALSVIPVALAAPKEKDKTDGTVYDLTPIGRDLVLGCTGPEEWYEGDPGDPGFANKQTIWVANVFTAVANEDLTSISFQVINPETEYEVYIVTDYADSSSLTNDRGEINTAGTMNEVGWHTIKLDSPVALTAGDKFAVVVKLFAPGWDYPASLEGFSDGSTANAGESYFNASEDGVIKAADDRECWIDITNYYPNANICLRAYTEGLLPTTDPTSEYDYTPLGMDFLVGFAETGLSSFSSGYLGFTEFPEPTDGTAWIANIFTAGPNETLSAVELQNPSWNTEYEVYVIADYNKKDGLTVPDEINTSGTLEPSGWHTINLDSPVVLEEGAQFAVIVKITTPGWNWPIPVECYSEGAAANPKEGFISMYGADGTWTDITKALNISAASLCLRAIATEASVAIEETAEGEAVMAEELVEEEISEGEESETEESVVNEEAAVVEETSGIDGVVPAE